MAPKAKQTRSVEEILTDIHNTLTEGLTAILDEVKKLTETDEVEVAAEVRVVEPAGAPIHEDGTPAEEEGPDTLVPAPEKERTSLTQIDHNDVPKDVSEWIEKHPGCTAAQVVKEFHIALNRAAAAVKKYGKPAAPKKVEEKPKISIEMLREKISEFAEKFGMNEALKVNDIFGGAKKVSLIPEKKYAAVYEEMDRRLSGGEEGAVPEAENTQDEVAVTIDDVRKAAQPFVDKYGDPAFRELLKKFGASKISAVEPSKYAALVEALSNA